MSDVLFITPNIRGKLETESLGTLLLATILKTNRISCKILPFGHIADVHFFDGFLQAALAKIDEEGPRIVSMYTRCDTFHISLRLAEVIKAHHPDVYIVFGGPQSDTVSTEVIAQMPCVDYVCCGEGENTIVPFFSSLLRGEPDLTIPGLVYRDNGEIVQNPRPELIHDLDSLPMIDFNGIYFDDYPEDIKNAQFCIDVGRGCPFGCAYCSTQAFWGRKYRLKSPQRIFEEVKAAHDDFGVTDFKFSHDMFTFSKKKVIETCNLLKTLDYPIKWNCSARLDCLDQEMIDAMVDAGMYNIFVGIETGSKRMQKIVHKNLNLDKVMDTLAYLRDKKISVDTSFVYGFPQETAVDLSQTLSLMAKIMDNHCGVINTHLCAFLPKTELSELYKDQLTPADIYSNFTGKTAIKECEELIHSHLELFPQLMEYKTDVRTSLQYFALFIRVWRKLVPVYQYIFERYSEDNAIQMYYDFVDVNRDALEKYGKLPLKKATEHLIREDRMHLCLENDPNYDLITDCRRMRIVEMSEAVKNGEYVMETYCFNPQERERICSIRDYERCVAVVIYRDKKTYVSICPIKKSDLSDG